MKVGPLPSAWVHTYRLQLAVGLIPQSMSAFLAASQDWMVPVVLRAFHLGMGEWLAEILRRRETMVGQARQAAGAPHRPGAAVVPSPAFQARQLSVAELRVADQQPLSPPRSAVAREVKLSRTIANKLAAELELPRWIKTHHFLHAVPVEQGEPSIALLLLWEADHKKEYPSQAVELMARLVSFTKRLTAAVEADAELKVWLVRKQIHGALSPGLPRSVYLRWSVRIDSTVGEPFLSTWKQHLSREVRRHHEVSASVGEEMYQGSPSQPTQVVQPCSRLKRKREGVAPPAQLQKKKPRVSKDAVIAQVARREGELVVPFFFSSSSSSSFSSSSPGCLPPPSGFQASGPPAGRLT